MKARRYSNTGRPFSGPRRVRSVNSGTLVAVLSARLALFATLLGLVCGLSAHAAETPACATCHPAETKLHERTHMAHAMEPVNASAFGQNLPEAPLSEGAGGYQLLYQRKPEGVAVFAERGTDRAAGLIQWVLGAGAQGETPLVRNAGHLLESRVSYFPALHQYGITIGQEAGASPNATAALGVNQPQHTLESCIGCHATAVNRNFEPVIAGVQCQRCHAGADDHAKGIGLPVNPGKLKPVNQVQLCGTCHRLKSPGDGKELDNVRFQPLRLSQSRCFTSGKLECTTCHVAHQDARRNDPAFYNEKCQSCHASQSPQGFHADSRQHGDCIGCHMPYVQLHPALRFTDHYIRIVKTGDYPESLFRQRGTGGS